MTSLTSPARHSRRRLTAATALVAAVALPLAGCSSGSSSAGAANTSSSAASSSAAGSSSAASSSTAASSAPASSSAASGSSAPSGTASSSAAPSSSNAPVNFTPGVADALTKPTTITVWSWAPQTVTVAKAFMAKYPSVKVNVVNAGTNTTEYTKLQNVIKAGSGAPDLAQVEYYALPQFAVQKGLVDLTSMNVASLSSQFTKSVWGSVSVGDKVYGIPQDSAPMAMFYRTDVFQKYGLTVPKTWDDYIADAKKLHAADPTEYMEPDSGDPGFVTSMIWQAGGHPFVVNGTKVTVNFHDAGTQKWLAVENQLVGGKLVDTKTPGWSNAWTKNITDGKYATILSGAWWPGILESSNQASSGKWSVAPLPQYTAGGTATAENGGSAFSLPKGGKNQLAALGFAEWMNTTQQGIDIWSKGGAFPSTTAQLNAPSYVNADVPFFGSVKVNQTLVTAGKNVVQGWQYLPFEVYANSIFGDSVGKAYAANADLGPALDTWGKSIANFGKQQGYSVSTG